MNFNINNQPGYDLNTSLTEEMIRLYGVLIKFLVTEKINKDDNVFGDYSHMKSDGSKIYDMYALPENSEDWDISQESYNNFGLMNFENISLFIAKSSFADFEDFGGINGNLLVLPNEKVMEVTSVDYVVPGVNNLFTYNNAKSVYKLSCKPYDFKIIHEIENEHISIDQTNVDNSLDSYFDELVNRAERQDNEAEIKPQVTTVKDIGIIDEKVIKPIIDRTEDDVWGQY
jgi:hypothetical protein